MAHSNGFSVGSCDPTERLSADDQATQREAEFLASALAAARRPVAPSAPGVCLNCGARLASLAVYCDADCRADHEHRLGCTQRGRRG